MVFIISSKRQCVLHAKLFDFLFWLGIFHVDFLHFGDDALRETHRPSANVQGASETSLLLHVPSLSFGHILALSTLTGGLGSNKDDEEHTENNKTVSSCWCWWVWTVLVCAGRGGEGVIEEPSKQWDGRLAVILFFILVRKQFARYRISRKDELGSGDGTAMVGWVWGKWIHIQLSIRTLAPFSLIIHIQWEWWPSFVIS